MIKSDMLYDEIENIYQKAIQVIEETREEVKVLYDKDGEFIAWLEGRYIFDSKMQPIMYNNEGNIWSWENKKWIGQLIGEGIFTDRSKIVFTLAPRKRLKAKKAIKHPRTSTRPPRPTSAPKKNIPDKQPQRTFKALFVDWEELL